MGLRSSGFGVLLVGVPRRVLGLCAYALVWTGLSGVISLLSSFRFGPGDIEYLRKVMPNCDEEFFVWLGQLSCRDVRMYALEEGMLCFPRVPLLVIEVRLPGTDGSYPA